MGEHRNQLVRLAIVLGVLLSLTAVATASAQMSSSNYSVDEAHFGSGAQQDMCTDTYCADGAAGDLTVGSGSSANYAAQFGSLTTADPLLEVIVTNTVTDVGVLDTTHTATATAGVQVRSYLSNGYVVQLTGNPPKHGSHTMAGMETPGESLPGTEQFGVNLVDNSTPDVGADPVQVPSSEFSFGVASIEYNTSNQFKYVDSDIIAESLTSSGRTDYTLSMILNISNLTPGGKYVSNLSVVVTPVF